MVKSLLLLMAMAGPAWAAAVANKPVANLFSKPSIDADVVSQIIYGAAADVLEDKAGWLRIRMADGYSGWAEAANFLIGDRPYASSGKTAWVESLAAHLYREPSVTKHQPVLTVPFETKLEIIAEPADNRRWLRVRLADDRAAWVQRGDLSFDMAPVSIDAMIGLARRFLGLPYTWGGTSSFGYDCSGYTQMLCRRRGILMPRDADIQAVWDGLKPVAKGELVAGDLLFFGRSAAKITHTGLYIGGGEFIHATVNTKPVIQISKLAEPTWTSILVACGRAK